MHSIINVLMTRAAERGTSVYEEAIRKAQFSSMTSPGDPCLVKFPAVLDPQWAEAQALMEQAAAGTLEDITGGANLYYNPRSIVTDKTITLPDGSKVNFPKPWNPAVVRYITTIAGHLFFKE